MASGTATEEIDLYGMLDGYVLNLGFNWVSKEVLGIAKSSSKSEIKKAYHKVGPHLLKHFWIY